MQVAAHTVGADHHDGAHAVARRLQDFCFADALAGFCTLGFGLGLNLLLIAFSTVAQLPSSAEKRSPLAAIGQFARFHEAPWRPSSRRRDCRKAFEKALHSGETEDGSSSYRGVELLDIGCIRAV